jgi:hypothetical protein
MLNVKKVFLMLWQTLQLPSSVEDIGWQVRDEGVTAWNSEWDS